MMEQGVEKVLSDDLRNAPASSMIDSNSNTFGCEKPVAEERIKIEECSAAVKPDTVETISGDPSAGCIIDKQDQQLNFQPPVKENLKELITDGLQGNTVKTEEAVQANTVLQATRDDYSGLVKLTSTLNGSMCKCSSTNEHETVSPKTQLECKDMESNDPNINADKLVTATNDSVTRPVSDSVTACPSEKMEENALESNKRTADFASPLETSGVSKECCAEITSPNSLSNVDKGDTPVADGKSKDKIESNLNEGSDSCDPKAGTDRNCSALHIFTDNSQPKASISTHDKPLINPAENVTGNIKGTVTDESQKSEFCNASSMASTAVEASLPVSDEHKNDRTPKNVQSINPINEANTCMLANASTTENVLMAVLVPVITAETEKGNQIDKTCDIPIAKSHSSMAENALKEKPSTLPIKKQASHQVEKSKTPVMAKSSLSEQTTKKTRAEEKGPALNKTINTKPADKPKQQIQKDQLKKPAGRVTKAKSISTKPAEKTKVGDKTAKPPEKTSKAKHDSSKKPSKPVGKTSMQNSTVEKPTHVVSMQNNPAEVLGVEMCGTQLSNLNSQDKTASSDIASLPNTAVSECTPSAQLVVNDKCDSIISSMMPPRCSTETEGKEMARNPETVVTLQNENLASGNEQLNTAGQSNGQAEAELKSPSLFAVQAVSLDNTSGTPLNLIEDMHTSNIIGAGETPKVSFDQQAEVASKPQATLEVDGVSNTPEVTHNKDNSLEQMALSNEPSVTKQPDPPNTPQMQDFSEKNTIQTDLEPQVSPAVHVEDFDEKVPCRTESNHIAVSSTSSPNEVQKMPIGTDCNGTGSIQINTTTSMDSNEDPSKQLPSISSDVNANKDPKPMMDAVSERQNESASAHVDPKSKTCGIL